MIRSISHRLRWIPWTLAGIAAPLACERPAPPPIPASTQSNETATPGATPPATSPLPADATPPPSPAEVNDIILSNGARDGLRFEGLRGTKDDPIVIRPRDTRRQLLVMNPTGDWSIELIDCQHVRLEYMQVFNANEGGILIRGTEDRPCRDIEVAYSDVLPRSSTVDYRIGVRIEHATNVEIADLNVLHAVDAAIDVRRAESVRIRDVVVRGVGPERYGVRLGVGVRNAVLRSIACVSISGNAFGIGIVGPDEVPGPEPEPACADVTVVRCSTDLGEAPISLGSAADVLVEYCTFMLPTQFVVEVDPTGSGWPAPTGIRFDRNLVQWLPGSLKAIFDPRVVQGIDRIGDNLWWSEELPEMLESLGGFSERADPQRIDIDPQVFRQRLEPLNPEAIPYGFRAERDLKAGDVE